MAFWGFGEFLLNRVVRLFRYCEAHEVQSRGSSITRRRGGTADAPGEQQDCGSQCRQCRDGAYAQEFAYGHDVSPSVERESPSISTRSLENIEIS